jgi:hypothetical protein
MMLKDIITKKTCRKKNQTICHFNFPSLAMEETKILEPTSLENLFPLEKTHSSEINNKFLDEFNKKDLQTTPTMPFITFLGSISIDKGMYVNVLKVKL